MKIFHSVTLAAVLVYAQQQQPREQWDEPGGNIRVQVRKSSLHGVADVSLIGRQDIGWLGFGIGSQMMDANIWICWPNGDSSAYLRHFKGLSGNIEPIQSMLRLNEQESRIHSSGNFVCRFEVSIPSPYPENLIWATGNISPSSNGIPMHSRDTRGTIRSNIFSIVSNMTDAERGFIQGGEKEDSDSNNADADKQKPNTGETIDCRSLSILALLLFVFI